MRVGAVPNQSLVSFTLRGENEGILVVMRSPSCTLYQYLQRKINAFIAYHVAFRPGVCRRHAVPCCVSLSPLDGADSGPVNS